MRDHFTTPSKKRKRIDQRTLMLLDEPDASRVAARLFDAQGRLERDMDLLMRLQFLEGVAGKQPGSFTGPLSSGRGTKRAIAKAMAHFETADPKWFSHDKVFWYPKVLIYVKRTIGENDTGKLLSSAVGDMPASVLIGALLAGIYPWSLAQIMREPGEGEDEKMPSPPVYDGGRRTPFTSGIESGEVGPDGNEVLNRVKTSLKTKLLDQIRRYNRLRSRHTDEMMQTEEDAVSRFDRAETQAEADAGDAFQTGLSMSPDLKDKLIQVIRKINDSNPKKGDSSKFAAFLDIIRGMSPTEAANELGALDDKGWPKRGVVPILMKQFGVSRGAITNAIPRAYAFVKESAARSTLAQRVWDEIEDASEVAGLGYSRSKWARGKIGAHHLIGKDVYVDSDFVNASQHVWPQAHLKHIGMGEFELVTPLGTIQFDRMRGIKFPGASGRGHLMYDDSDGRAMKELLAKMESAGKSERRASERTVVRAVMARGLTVDPAQRVEWTQKHLRTKDTAFLAVSPGTIVSVHLNLHKRPYFSIKHPPAREGGATFGKSVVGYSRNLELSNAFFFVADSGRKSTAMAGGSKTPFAGPTGVLTGVELPPESEGTPAFGSVGGGGEEIKYNPRTYPAYMSLFFCRRGPSGQFDVPVASAAKVVMRDWKVFASGVKDMSAAEIDDVLARLGLTREDMQSARGKTAAGYAGWGE